MKDVALMGALNRHATASDGYKRFQISRANIEYMLHLVQYNPAVLEAILQDCVEQRGQDKRKSS